MSSELRGRLAQLTILGLFISVFIVLPSSAQQVLSDTLFLAGYREVLLLQHDEDGRVEQVAWMPNAEKIASLGYETIRVWDAATGEELNHIDAKSVLSLTWSPDGTMIAGGGGVKTIDSDLGIGEAAWVWDSKTGQILASFTIRFGEPSFPHLSSIAWQPEGVILAAGGLDGAVHLWNTETGEELKGEVAPTLFLSEVDYVNSIAWDMQGQRLAIADTSGVGIVSVDEDGMKDDGSSLTLDPATLLGETVLVDWNVDGERLVTVGKDNVIRVWNVTAEEVLLTLSKGGNWDDIDWHPNGIVLASVSEDGAVVFWDAETGEEFTELPIDNATSFDWNPDGSQFAVGESDGSIAIWSAATNGNN